MRLHIMSDDEFKLRQQQQWDQRKHWQQSKRSSQSKRTVKGHAKGFNVPMKHSKVYSAGMETLRWSPWSYKAIGNNFNVNRAS
jgi:hypothetical protein